MASTVRFFEDRQLHVAILGKFAHKLDLSFNGKQPRFEIATSRATLEVAGRATSFETFEFTRPCDIPSSQLDRYSSVELDDLSKMILTPLSDEMQRAAQLGGELYVRLRRATSNLLPFLSPGFDKLLFSLFEAYLTETEVDRPEQLGKGVIITPQAFESIFDGDISARVIKYLRVSDGEVREAGESFERALTSISNKICSSGTKKKITECLREFRKTLKDPKTEKIISRLANPRLYPKRHQLLSAEAIIIPDHASDLSTQNFGGLYRYFLQNQEDALDIAQSEPKHALIVMYLFSKISSDFSVHETAEALAALYPEGFVPARSAAENENLFDAYAAEVESKYKSIVTETGDERSPKAIIAKFLRDYAFRIHHKKFNPQNSATREGLLDWTLSILLDASSEVMEGVPSAKAAVEALIDYSAHADKSLRAARAAGALSEQQINHILSIEQLQDRLSKSFLLLNNPKQTELLAEKLTSSLGKALERWRTDLVKAIREDLPEEEFDKLFQKHLGLADTEITQAHWDAFGAVVDIDLRGLELDYLRLTRGAATGADLSLFIPGSSHATGPDLAREKTQSIAEPKSTEEKEAASERAEERQRQLRQEAQTVALGPGQPVPGLAPKQAIAADKSIIQPNGWI
ncbi:hypothetical protein ACVWW4_008981 [Bradyrhizobium sp. LB7.1]